MFGIIKRIRWDLQDRIGRFNYWSAFLRNFPGEAGMELRSSYIPRFFAAAGEGIRIHEGVRIRGVHAIRAGDGCEIGVDCFLQASGGLSFGRNVMLGPGVKIWTLNHRFENVDAPIASQGYDAEAVSIGDDCWLGANVFVMPGVELPEGCVVSAGTVVAKKKYPPWSVLAGYPARVVARRKADDPVTAAQAAGDPAATDT